MISRVVSTCKFFKKLQITFALQARAILLSLKNLQVLIKTKLHSKSCYYQYKRRQ